MASRLLQRLAVGGGLLLALVLSSPPAAATPPVTVKGLGVPTALSFYDRARRAAAVVRRIAPADRESDGRTSRLETIDTVVLDPGHGNDNSGAIGVTGVAEKYLTLELAYALREKLQRKFPDLRVVLTRYWDRSVSLHDRTHLANRVGADLFLSLHYNSAVHQRAVGYETYFLETPQAIPGKQSEKGEPIATTAPGVTGIRRDSSEREFGVQGDSLAIIRRDLKRARQHLWSGRLAETVQRKLRDHVDSVDRGVKQANFAVLRGALMPAVVVESGFLSHPEEGRRVHRAEHRRKLVDSLVDAVVTFDRRRANPGEVELEPREPAE